MLTRFKSEFKKVLSKKFIFQNELYQINLDEKTFNIFGVKCNFRKKLFNQSFSNLSMLFQTDKASFIHRVTPKLPSKEYIRTITQSHDYAKYYDKLFLKKAKLKIFRNWNYEWSKHRCILFFSLNPNFSL